MPIYAYSCRDCGRNFDIRQEFSDASLTVCEACGGRLRKQFGSIGVTFNGPGFYRTDSRGGKSNKVGSAASSKDSSSSNSSSSGSDSSSSTGSSSSSESSSSSSSTSSSKTSSATTAAK